jgi:hypothetical protein
MLLQTNLKKSILENFGMISPYKKQLGHFISTLAVWDLLLIKLSTQGKAKFKLECNRLVQDLVDVAKKT